MVPTVKKKRNRYNSFTPETGLTKQKKNESISSESPPVNLFKAIISQVGSHRSKNVYIGT